MGPAAPGVAGVEDVECVDLASQRPLVLCLRACCLFFSHDKPSIVSQCGGGVELHSHFRDPAGRITWDGV